MSHYLAEVVMPMVDDTEENEEEIDYGSGDDSIPEGEPPAVESEPIEEPIEEEPDPIPEAKPKRVKIPQEEIFNPPQVQTITGTEEQPKKKQVRKKRGPPSEAQLERLRLGREKALANRRAKAELKKKAKAQQEEDKQLMEQVKSKQRQKLKKQLEEPDTESPAKIIEKPIVVEKGYSQEQLDMAVQKAVEESVNKVEVMRKARKAKKQKEQAQQKHDAKVFHNINTAAKNDVWADCFR